MSGMRVLAGRRAAVASCPVWEAFPPAASDARYDSPSASGGRSRGPDCSASLSGVSPQRDSARLGLWPGVPLWAPIAVSHPVRRPAHRHVGASQVLARLSSCLPRPADSGGPASPCHCGESCMAFGVRSHPRRPPQAPCRRCPSTAGDTAPPAASRRRWLRFVPLVRRVCAPDSAMDASLTTGGWLALPRPGLAPCKRRPAYLGARTLRFTCTGERYSAASAPYQPRSPVSGASGC
jgi:hypothetical protein